MVQTDALLTQLRASWQEKHDEAERIISDPASSGTPGLLVKAEQLFDERDRIGEQIEDRRATLERVGQLRDRYTAGKGWAGEPIRNLPFPGGGSGGSGRADRMPLGHDGAAQFRWTGTEPAGSVEIGFDPGRKHWEMVREAGAGTFGESKWQLLDSFEYRRDFALYLRKGNRFADLCTKTLMEGMDDQGGIFAPAELVARVIGRLPAPTHLRSLVTTLTTGRDLLILPRKQYAADDIYTTAFRVNWTGEVPIDGTGAQAQVDDRALLGTVEIPVHTAMLTAPVTRNLIEDGAFPIQAWLESELAMVVDLLYENMIVAGTGIGQPSGILLGAASGNNGLGATAQYPRVILSSTAGNVDYSLFANLETSLPPQYENEGTRWVMNKQSTLAALYNLVDTQQRPLFSTGMQDYGLAAPRRRIVLGQEIVLSSFMPSVGAANFPVIYGDLRGHFVAQRVGFSIQVLDQTRAKANQIELVGRVRFGCKTIEPFRLCVGKSNNA